VWLSMRLYSEARRAPRRRHRGPAHARRVERQEATLFAVLAAVFPIRARRTFVALSAAMPVIDIWPPTSERWVSRAQEGSRSLICKPDVVIWRYWLNLLYRQAARSRASTMFTVRRFVRVWRRQSSSSTQSTRVSRTTRSHLAPMGSQSLCTLRDRRAMFRLSRHRLYRILLWRRSQPSMHAKRLSKKFAGLYLERCVRRVLRRRYLRQRAVPRPVQLSPSAC
jgi:hypothetical protein